MPSCGRAPCDAGRIVSVVTALTEVACKFKLFPCVSLKLPDGVTFHRRSRQMTL